MQYWYNIVHKVDSNYWQASNVLANHPGVSPAKDMILLHPSKTKRMSPSAMKGYPWQVEIILQFFKPSHCHKEIRNSFMSSSCVSSGLTMQKGT